jgi:hypothetical protein
MVGFCKHGNEPIGSNTIVEVFGQLSEYQLLKRLYSMELDFYVTLQIYIQSIFSDTIKL